MYASKMDLFENFDLVSFRRDLFAWWKVNRRLYPWRETRDPYQVIIAEVLLHRTRADQVVPVYLEFLKRYPSVSELAKASAEKIGILIQSLGLHWRVEMLQDMAQQLHTRFNDQVPTEREDLESLPGVSHYIATAVRCFAYKYTDALLDTNTVRICGRLLGIPVTDGSRRSKKFRNLMQNLLDPDHPRDFNFALLDHGALICRSRNPLCHKCPVRTHCSSGNNLSG